MAISKKPLSKHSGGSGRPRHGKGGGRGGRGSAAGRGGGRGRAPPALAEEEGSSEQSDGEKEEDKSAKSEEDKVARFQNMDIHDCVDRGRAESDMCR